MRRLAVLALSVALGAGAAGCVRKPTMKLNHAEVGGVQVGFPLQIAVVMNVVLDIYNPNSYDVAVRAVRGQTTLADHFLVPVDFRAQDPNGIWLPAKQTTTIAVPVVIPVQTGIAVLQTAVTTPQVGYHFIGKADVTAFRSLQIEKDDYSVDEDGQIPREQFAMALQSVMPRW